MSDDPKTSQPVMLYAAYSPAETERTGALFVVCDPATGSLHKATLLIENEGDAPPDAEVSGPFDVSKIIRFERADVDVPLSEFQNFLRERDGVGTDPMDGRELTGFSSSEGEHEFPRD